MRSSCSVDSAPLRNLSRLSRFNFWQRSLLKQKKKGCSGFCSPPQLGSASHCNRAGKEETGTPPPMTAQSISQGHKCCCKRLNHSAPGCQSPSQGRGAMRYKWPSLRIHSQMIPGWFLMNVLLSSYPLLALLPTVALTKENRISDGCGASDMKSCRYRRSKHTEGNRQRHGRAAAGTVCPWYLSSSLL